MDIILSGGDLGGSVQHIDAEPAVGTILTFGSLNYRYNGAGVALYDGPAG